MQHRQLNLEGIGNFFIGSLTEENENAAILSSGTVNFSFDKKALTDAAFGDYLAAQIGKPKSLVSSDFSSHLEQIRSFINIGKPYEIPGIGIILKNDAGAYELTSSSAKPEIAKQIKTAAKTDEVASQHRRNGRGLIKFLTAILILLVLAGLGWGAYSLFIKNVNWSSNDNNATLKDNSLKNVNNETINSTSNSSTPPVVNTSDSLLCKYVQEITPLLMRAESRTQKLKQYGYNAGFDTLGNKNYKIYTLHKALASDTLHLKDLLEKNFQKKYLLKS